MTVNEFLAIFPSGKSLAFEEINKALRAIATGDCTAIWNEAVDTRAIIELDPYCYRNGDDVAEVDALRRRLADIYEAAGYIKYSLEHLRDLNEKYYKTLREPQRDLSILLSAIKRLVP